MSKTELQKAKEERWSEIFGYFILTLTHEVIWLGSFVLVGIGFFLMNSYSAAGGFILVAGMFTNAISLMWMVRISKDYHSKIEKINQRIRKMEE